MLNEFSTDAPWYTAYTLSGDTQQKTRQKHISSTAWGLPAADKAAKITTRPHSCLQGSKWKLSYLAIKDKLTITDYFNLCLNCIVLITSTISISFFWRNMPSVLSALQRAHSSKDDHGNFDEKRQIFFLNAWELKHLNSTVCLDRKKGSVLWFANLHSTGQTVLEQ